MANFIVDRRDQNFVLYEMFKIEELCSSESYKEFSKETFDMVLDLAAQMGEEVSFPTYQKGDSEGCTFKDGSVTIPPCYRDAHQKLNESGLFTVGISQAAGGQGFPYVIDCAVKEYFTYNMGFFLYPEAAIGAGHLVEVFGTEKQKKTYMEKIYAGQWGGTMVLTEPSAGSDVGALKTKAVRMPDGTFRITGQKIFITSAENDLFSNIVHPVLARIEGDPAGTEGISIFLVPKYCVNDDGSLGKRNDYSIMNIEHKMGLKGNATCAMSFGDNNECYAELLGEERKGMRIMFQMMNEARIGMGIQGVSTASIAYLHALNYAKERVQGKRLQDMANPGAPSTQIIKHPDVRRMLMWMKSHVEGMRALVYLCAFAIDKKHAVEGAESEKWHGIMELLIPICKAYNTDMGFRVCELAVQTYGGYGYCNEFPVGQFLRDLKIGSIYEGTNGIQALDLVARKITAKKGANFMNFLQEMNKTIDTYKSNERLADIADDVQKSANLLAEMGMFFMKCAKEGKFHLPVNNAYPFLCMMGNICLGWLLFWQAGIAQEKLEKIFTERGVDPNNGKAIRSLLREHKDAAFYQGKLYGARYYMKNILPEAFALANAIKNEDNSINEILEESFAS